MKQFSLIDPDSIPWTRVSKGVYRKDLLKDRKTKQLLSLFKIEKGARLKTHKHPEKEWVTVLDGIYQDEYTTAKKGMVKVNAKGSVHTSQSRYGCTLLVLWCGRHIIV